MTQEEAKEFFKGYEFEPYLKEFNENKSHNRKVSKLKKGRSYWYYHTKDEIDITKRTGVRSGWLRYTVTYKRVDVNFIRFDKDKENLSESWVVDGSLVVQESIPEKLYLSEVGFKNKDLVFLISNMDGKIEIINDIP